MSAIFTILLISVSLAMDAFSVSIVSSVKVSRVRLSEAVRMGTYFGVFQAVMPAIGFLIGNSLNSFVEDWSGIIGCILLSIVGAKMIYESRQDDDDSIGDAHSTRTMIGLAFATSIDALIVGTTLSLVEIPILASLIIIGVVTFAFCVVGYLFGARLGKLFGKHAETVGGIVLIGLGISFLF
jgi:putative Mn2+ efflux pump MntP